MHPDQARVVADFLLSMLEQELKTTTDVLAAAPRDGLDYQPDTKSKSGRGLLRRCRKPGAARHAFLLRAAGVLLHGAAGMLLI